MGDPELERLVQQIERLTERLQAVENVSAPRQREVIADLRERQRELVADIRELRAKQEEMDVEGTAVTKIRLHQIEEWIRNTDANKAADRRAVLIAMIGAAVAIGGVVVQVVKG